MEEDTKLLHNRRFSHLIQGGVVPRKLELTGHGVIPGLSLGIVRHSMAPFRTTKLRVSIKCQGGALTDFMRVSDGKAIVTVGEVEEVVI